MNGEGEQVQRDVVDVVCLQVTTYIVVMVCRCSFGLRHYSIHRLFLISLDIDSVDGRCHWIIFFTALSCIESNPSLVASNSIVLIPHYLIYTTTRWSHTTSRPSSCGGI